MGRDRTSGAVIPLHKKGAVDSKTKDATSRVPVFKITRQRLDLVDGLLASDRFEVQKTQVRQPVRSMPQVHLEGETIVVPIVDEYLVVEHRLYLREEIRIRRLRKLERHAAVQAGSLKEEK
jgi:stress response protein YsnF